MSAPVLAIDIGGTKVASAVVAEDGMILARRIGATPTGEPLAAFGEILTAAAGLAEPWPVAAAGIVLPAVIEAGTVSWAAASIAGWDGLPLAAIAREALGVPVVADFDGYAATVGEARFGAGRGASDVVVVIAGTGVGAGIVHDGVLYRGATGVAGALGWMRWPTPDGLGPPMESVAAGPGILAAARRAADLAGRDGAAAFPDTPAVFDALATSDPAAAAAVDRAVLALASGVGAIVGLLAPDVVVLGGGVGSRPDVVARIRDLVRATTQPHTAERVRIEASTLGPLSSLFGAACFAFERIKPAPSGATDAHHEEPA